MASWQIPGEGGRLRVRVGSVFERGFRVLLSSLTKLLRRYYKQSDFVMAVGQAMCSNLAGFKGLPRMVS